GSVTAPLSDALRTTLRIRDPSLCAETLRIRFASLKVHRYGSATPDAEGGSVTAPQCDALRTTLRLRNATLCAQRYGSAICRSACNVAAPPSVALRAKRCGSVLGRFWVPLRGGARAVERCGSSGLGCAGDGA